MNYRLISQVLGRVIAIEAALMLIPVVVAMVHGESIIPFVLSIALAGVCAFFMMRFKPEYNEYDAREGFVTVALSWIIMSAFGALPFVISGEIPNFIDAYFETVSGFTTTGSTVVTDVEGMSKGLMFWRCFTNWIGGMGVLVFVMFVVPMGKEHSIHFLRAEMPGPVVGKLVPKVRDTAMILYVIYTVMTVAIIILLMAGGLSLYDAACHAFSVAGTGGFGTYGTSIAYFESAYIDYVVAIGMLLFGVNFNLYFMLLIGKIKDVFRNEELLWYVGIVAVVSLMITGSIYRAGEYESVPEAFRYAFFQVSSIITTTGHVTADYDVWPMFAKMLLFLLMFTGASAGGTNGGVKISRLLIAGKTMLNEIHHQIRPREVQTVKINGEVVSRETQRMAMVFLVLYLFIVIISALIVSLDNFDFTSSFTAVVACIGNIGPGSGICGPTGNFAAFSSLSKITLSACMLLGRLEIIPILMLFVPSVWKKKF